MIKNPAHSLETSYSMLAYDMCVNQEVTEYDLTIKINKVIVQADLNSILSLLILLGRFDHRVMIKSLTLKLIDFYALLQKNEILHSIQKSIQR